MILMVVLFISIMVINDDEGGVYYIESFDDYDK